MRVMLYLAAVLFAFASASASAERMYRWVDSAGGVHYTQHPPPQSAKDVQKRSISGDAPGTIELPYATQLAARKYPVSLYVSADCGKPCEQASQTLEKRGVPFDLIKVADQQSLQKLEHLTGKSEVPVLVVGKQFKVGFEPVAWKQALDAAGYPSSGPPVRGRIAPKGAKSLPAVKLYTSVDCGSLCAGARSALAARGIKFQEVVVSATKPNSLAELKKVAGNTNVPVLLVGERVQRGFAPDVYKQVLDAAGFPARAQRKAPVSPAPK